jgi:microcystin-dependent protein
MKCGEIAIFAGSNLPDNRLWCDGSAISREDYAELYACIGTVFGIGDGETTFNLPDLRDRSPFGASENYSLGDIGGEITHTLVTNELPSHAHQETGRTGALYYRQGGGGANIMPQESTTGSDTPMDTASVGGGAAHNNLHPVLVLNFIIAISDDACGEGNCDEFLGSDDVNFLLDAGYPRLYPVTGQLEEWENPYKQKYAVWDY